MTADQNARCAVHLEPSHTVTLAPEVNTEYLNEQRLAGYREYRYEFINWLRRKGKNPEAYEGYSDHAVYW